MLRNVINKDDYTLKILFSRIFNILFIYFFEKGKKNLNRGFVNTH